MAGILLGIHFILFYQAVKITTIANATFLGTLGGLKDKEHLLEGHNLVPLLHGKEKILKRDAVFSEIDYSPKPARKYLEQEPARSRGYMVRTQKWKYILF